MSPSVADSAFPSASLMLTVKVQGMPAVHLVYDHSRAVEETAVTILDQGRRAPAWRLEDVVRHTLAFLLNYYAARSRWPAELRAVCAGRMTKEEDIGDGY